MMAERRALIEQLLIKHGGAMAPHATKADLLVVSARAPLADTALINLRSRVKNVLAVAHKVISAEYICQTLISFSQLDAADFVVPLQQLSAPPKSVHKSPRKPHNATVTSCCVHV